MKLIIDAFSHSDSNKIPKKYTCDGEQISPGMRWENVPQGTKSFAILMEDPDVPHRSNPFVHWLVYNIPADIHEFKTNSIPKEAQLGINDFGKQKYSGPCPNPSAKHHRYFVKLYALDALIDLPNGATKQEFLHAIRSHILAEDEVIGDYERF